MLVPLRTKPVMTYMGVAQLLPGTPIPFQARTMEEFIIELKTVLEGNRVDMRPINYLFSRADFLLNCNGDWMEFGVFDGKKFRLFLYTSFLYFSSNFEGEVVPFLCTKCCAPVVVPETVVRKWISAVWCVSLRWMLLVNVQHLPSTGWLAASKLFWITYS